MKLKSILASLLIAAATATAALAQQPSTPLSNIGNSLQSSNAQIALPAEDVQVRLINETMDNFLEGIKAKTMQALFDSGSQHIKSQFTVEKLNDIFKAFLQVPVTGKPLQNLSPIFTTPAQPQGQSAFKIQGFYPTQPQNVTFDATYIREGSGWKWVALFVRIQPAGQTGS